MFVPCSLRKHLITAHVVKYFTVTSATTVWKSFSFKSVFFKSIKDICSFSSQIPNLMHSQIKIKQSLPSRDYNCLFLNQALMEDPLKGALAQVSGFPPTCLQVLCVHCYACIMPVLANIHLWVDLVLKSLLVFLACEQ